VASFKPNPNFERDLRQQVMQNLGKLRPIVQSVGCPEHHLSPDLVHEGDGLQIVACCKTSAELAAAKAGLGQVSWRER
jgi:hypothetical protein